MTDGVRLESSKYGLSGAGNDGSSDRVIPAVGDGSRGTSVGCVVAQPGALWLVSQATACIKEIGQANRPILVSLG